MYNCRFPLQVNLTCSDLKKEMCRALSTSCCTLAGRGSSGYEHAVSFISLVDMLTCDILSVVFVSTGM